ncbi:hypothetical protein SAMN05444162_3392 [Paenibacillaceae bacterium GAS479]|nr:hypothetical protein SAMN05444162_3392 [Paenibacillaceae bacterium GAS479]
MNMKSVLLLIFSILLFSIYTYDFSNNLLTNNKMDLFSFFMIIGSSILIFNSATNLINKSGNKDSKKQ